MLHDYECPKCGHIEEQNLKATDVAKCSKCGSETKRVYLSSAKVHIKHEDKAAP